MVFTSYDKKQIFIREWTRTEDPIGVVQIVHGMNEYAARYNAFAERLNELGYIVVADDHRGHGDTDPETLGYSEGDMFGDTLKDMAGMAKMYREKYEGLKYVLFGFSYGSFLTQAFLERYGHYIDGAIIAGSSRQNGALVAFGRMISALGGTIKGKDAPAKLIDRLVFGGYDKKIGDGEWQWLSTNRASNNQYREDPFCNFNCSYNFYSAFFKGLSGLYKSANAQKLDTEMPVLLISGADDPVGGAAGVERLFSFYKRWGMKRVRKVLLEGSRHEFLNEPEHFEEAFREIAAFLKGVSRRSR